MDEYKLPTNITPENYFFKFIVWEFQTIFDQSVYALTCQIHTIRINPALLMGHSGPFEYIMQDSVNFLSVLSSFCI